MSLIVLYRVRNISTLNRGDEERWRDKVRLNPIRPGGGGGGAESARTNFNLRELLCYLSNTYKTLPLALKFIGEQDSEKIFLSRV